MSLTDAGSSTNAAFGAVSGVVELVTQSGAAPDVLVATQPAGSAVTLTESKLSVIALGKPTVNGNVTVPRLLEPSCNWNVAVRVCPHVAVDVNEKARVAAAAFAANAP